MKIIYLATVEYGLPALFEIEVVKETPNMFITNGSYANIIGKTYYLPSRISKSGNVFDTEQAALQHLEKRMTEYISRQTQSINNAKRALQDIKAKMEE
jgi:hypothetical protein